MFLARASARAIAAFGPVWTCKSDWRSRAFTVSNIRVFCIASKPLRCLLSMFELSKPVRAFPIADIPRKEGILNRS